MYNLKLLKLSTCFVVGQGIQLVMVNSAVISWQPNMSSSTVATVLRAYRVIV